MLTPLTFPAAKEVTNLPTVFNIRSRQKGLTRSIGPPYPVHAKPAVLDQNPADFPEELLARTCSHDGLFYQPPCQIKAIESLDFQFALLPDRDIARDLRCANDSSTGSGLRMSGLL